MARALRICQAGLIYHVINRGNNRQNIFLDEDDYSRYLGVVYRFKKFYKFKLFAFCLMTNHVHLLIQIGAKGSISKVMQSITLAHTKYYHHKYQTTGHVWQGRFKSPVVSDDEHLLEVMRYIENNPVKAGMVSNPDKYQWSSYLLNIRREDSKLLDREDNLSYQSLAVDPMARIKVYKRFVRDDMCAEKLQKLEQSMLGVGHYMSEAFEKRTFGSLTQKRWRGRPRKN